MTSAPVKSIDADTAQHLADLFKTLGDPTRIKILSLLTKTEEMRVYDIADSLTMGQSAISHQLRVLRSARLVKFRRDGKEVLYSIDDDHVMKLLGQGLEHVQHA
ncbi:MULTISPECIES: metalloregulator ArsR/SmtB family transcription factor [Selenomonas]|jgi:metal transport repressor protein czrA|uniref:ArsR/SmtB family transcription factor n=1 Tax=Selenomonas TaxID=970 RepID=UPI0001E07F73|nr:MULTISPECIES: metalloregulator ArsR/SmtB family transcription factor [Selenomonas]AKT54849.1 ArsR family transcriptional regulator [Selenomonas sp. oral taxon 478]AME04415.1 ArsR family transcriptional regulator [Selenomonas sp. oral taxon 136]EFM24016.1 transcriptional regulator, ArsR family [Selenomonas sp. oral taxon 149 str. 67H29BP]MBF1685494.1 helix-turn-helix transcriptional regulator [Selenomonas sp.]MBF1686860.1 helix-turn-helix transcriptional regulator [Selenomonas sp.]